MRLKDLLNPIDGLFSAMPQDIWGPDFDPSMLDIELFTRIGALESSPLTDFYVDATSGDLDTEALAKLLFQKYGANWKRIWDALVIEYDILLTSTLDETRTTTRDNTALETRALKDKGSENIDKTLGNTQTNVKSGSLDREREDLTTYDTTDTETRALASSEATTGTDKSTDTFNETNAITKDLTKTGSESTSGTDLETRALANSEATTGTDKSTDTFNETNAITKDLTKTGSENTAGTDLETRDLKSTSKATGDDTSLDTFADTHNTGNTLVKTGTEKTVGKDDETRALTGSDTGTVKNIDKLTQTGTGSHSIEAGVYGIGGTGLAPNTKNVDAETRNFIDSTDKAETRALASTDAGTVKKELGSDLTFIGRTDTTTGSDAHTGTITNKFTHGKDVAETDTGTANHVTNETLTFTARKDSESGSDVHTGTVANELVHGKTTTGSDTGTVNHATDETLTFTGRVDSESGTDVHTGTVANEFVHGKTSTGSDTGTVTTGHDGTDTLKVTDKETYTNITDALTGSGTDVTVVGNETDHTGTVGNKEDEISEDIFHSEGSSPLRTYQALITEEIMGRSGPGWNFTDLVIANVQSMIASKIWSRQRRLF